MAARESRVAMALRSRAAKKLAGARAEAYQERKVPAGVRWALSVLASLGEWAEATLIALRRRRTGGAPPVCEPDGADVVIKGTALPGDERTRLMLPFEIRPGTGRLEVDYEWKVLPPAPPDNPLTQTVLDLGLWDEHGYRDAEGFRGWSGSRATSVFVQADDASRAYRPGPIGAGVWYVELGIAAVGPTGADWTVTARARRNPAPPQQPARPVATGRVDPTHVARPGPGWYHGDFHMHAWHSNPEGPTPERFVELARAAGLDFFPITEYVVGHHWDEYGAVQAANPDVLVWPGREIVTYSGHVNCLGETDGFIEFRHAFEDVRIGDIQRQVRAAGALFQVNHPTTFPGPLFRNLCRGCEFELGDDIDWDAVDTIEILTGEALVDPGDYQLPDLGVRVPNPFFGSAVDLWERLLNEGHRITAVCGSDDKIGDRYGACATAVGARELSRAGIVEALREGRAYVRARGVADSPVLELEAVAPGQEAGTFGSTLVLDGPGPGAPAELRVTVRRGEGQVLRLVRAGEVVGTVTVDADPFDHVFPITADGGAKWCRIETADDRGRTAIGNPVFLRRG
ncbi:MAG TPA: CehA/McbA family metallohydrolase [Acidimicrobiales bacterium]